MKKLKQSLAVIIAVIMAVAVLPLGASAAQSNKSEAETLMAEARAYVFGKTESFTYDKSGDFLLYLRAEGEIDKFASDYIASVKQALSEDKLTDAATIACIIMILGDYTDTDCTAFTYADGKTVNLLDLLEKSQINTANPYYLRYIFEAGQQFSISETFLKDADAKLEALYTMGQGMDYYGFSCDNTANFAAAKAASDTALGLETPSKSLTDALSLLANYFVKAGYYYNATYGTDPNVDSTASALLAYSAAGDSYNADAAYDMLANFAVDGKAGAYSYELEGAENAYGSKDALNALVYYYNSIDDTEPTTTETDTSTPQDIGKTATTQSTPATGEEAPYIIFGGIALIAAVAAVISFENKKKVQE